MSRRLRLSFYGVALATGLLAVVPWAVTQAVWTDSDAVDDNTFSTGSISLSASPTTALLSLSGMMPGDAVTAPLTISNDGSAELRYAMSTTIAGSTALADGLTLGVKVGVSDCTNGGFAGSGTSLYDGSLTAGAIGDAAQGAQTGDRVLAAGASETLCFKVTLPSNASDTLQGLSTTATFQFTGEQTAGNP